MEGFENPASCWRDVEFQGSAIAAALLGVQNPGIVVAQ